MELVPSDFVTEDERACTALLATHPHEAYLLIRLINGYRELASTCMEMMQEGETDTADVARSLDKKDAAMRRLGIPVVETLEDWEQLRKMREA